MRKERIGLVLLLAVFALVGGEACAFACDRVAAAWPWMAGAVLLWALAAWGWRVRHVGLMLVFLGGWVLASRVETQRRDVLRTYSGRSGPGAPPAVLPVESVPEIRARKRGGRTCSFLSHLGVVPVRVSWPETAGAQMPQCGERWRFSGALSRTPVRPGRFMRHAFWCRGAGMRPAASSESDSVGAVWIARLATACAGRAALGLGWCPELCALNRAILLGCRSDLSREKRRVFADAGTIHLFAISGLHVMLVAKIVLTGLAFTPVPQRLRGLCALPILVTYVFVTGSRPSAVRALLMAGIYLTAPAFGRRSDALTAWSLTALAVYALYPQRLFETGCTLSFAVMFGIVVWLKWIEPVLSERMRRGLVSSLGISLTAWAAGVPLVAHVFGRFTPGGILANLVVLPLAAYMVHFGFAGIVTGFLFTPLAVVFNHLAALVTLLMMLASAFVAALPFASYEITPWPAGVCIAWYAALGGLLGLLRRALRRRESVWWKGKLS